VERKTAQFEGAFEISEMLRLPGVKALPEQQFPVYPVLSRDGAELNRMVSEKAAAASGMVAAQTVSMRIAMRA